MTGPGYFSGMALVKIDGQTLNADIALLIETATIDDHLHLPDQLSIVWRDPNREVLEKARAKIGSKIEVGVVSVGRGESDGDVLFCGEIVSLEGSYGALGERVILRAYDLSHRLHRGRRTAAYKGMRDSDIAAKLAEEARLEIGEIQRTSEVHDQVSQINLTDWEFLKARGRELGLDVGVNDGKFVFRKPKVNQGAPGTSSLTNSGALQLLYGADLIEFHPTLSAAAQVKNVVARGWSYLDKKATVGTASTADCNSAPKISMTPNEAASKFPNTQTFSVTDRVLTKQDEAQNAAEGMARQITASFAEADGVVRGNPKVRSGVAVSIGAVAENFVGDWTVTTSRHVFDVEGYRTYFSVTGRQERSLLGLSSGGASSGVMSAGGPPIYGVVVGLVSQIKDPKNLNRVRLTFPWLSEDYETDWVRMTTPGSGAGYGISWLPEVGDEVLVAFEQGDVRSPYVIGSLYNGKDNMSKKPAYDSSGRVKERRITSTEGHTIRFGETANKGIFLRTADENVSIFLDHAEMILSLNSNGKLEIYGKEIVIDSMTSIKLKAATEIEMEAPKIKIDGSATVDIDSKLITLN